MQIQGRQRERVEPSLWQALPYFLPVAVILLVANAAVRGGWWMLPPLTFFLFADTFDKAFGTEERNINPETAKKEQLIWYKLALWTCVTLWPITLVFALWQMLVVGDLAFWEVLLMAFVVANVSTMILVAGHDVIHERSNWQRWIGEFLLSSVGCAHYAGDHIYIHHAHVATPRDPMSARKGQTFWQYFPWAVGGSLLGSWRTVCKRLEQRHLPSWHLSNPFWRYLLFTTAWFALAAAMGGLWGLFIFSIHVALSFLSLRLGDYIEHYGLTRLHLANGRFETVQPWHSWCAAARFSNWLYYNTQRHADHHCKPTRFYPLLQNRPGEEAPRMPGGYAAVTNMAMSPKRWFETMDPLVEAWRRRHYPQISNWSVYDSQAFASRPDSFDAITEIHATAPRLSHWLERFPELLDSLKEKEFTDLDIPSGFGPDPEFEAIARSGLTRLYWTREYGVADMRQHIADIPTQGVRETVAAVRAWSNAKVFQIAMHMVRGNLLPIEAETALSNVAEAAVVSVLTAVCEHFGDRCEEGGVAVVVLGDLASGEVTSGVELNLVFVYDGRARRHLKVLCRRYWQALQALARGSLLFAPLAGSANTAHSLAGFVEHHATVASHAESLSLTRARCIFTGGKPEMAATFENARHRILADPRHRDALIAMLEEQLDRNTNPDREAEPCLHAVANGPGGTRDLDGIARLLQLSHVAAPAEHGAPSAVSVFRAAQEHGTISGPACQSLVEAARMLRNFKGILALTMNPADPVESASPTAKAVVAKACGCSNLHSLATRLDELAVAAAAEIDAIWQQMLDLHCDGRTAAPTQRHQPTPNEVTHLNAHA